MGWLQRLTGFRSLQSIAAMSLALAVALSSWSVLSSGSDAGYGAGDVVVELPEGTLAPSGRTLVIYFKPDCVACLESLEFYRHLTSIKERVPIVFVSRSKVVDVSKVLSQAAVVPNRIVSIGDRPARFRQSPKLMLLAPDGLILRVWVGRLEDTASQDEVVRAVQG